MSDTSPIGLTKRKRLSTRDLIPDDTERQVIFKLDKIFNNKIEEMRREKKLCDVKLVAKNGEEIWAHKVILAANSDYFHCMFNSDFIESKQSEIFINEIDPVILKLLVDFIYTSQLVITEQHVQGILMGVCMLQLDYSLCDACINFLQSKIDPTNCFDMMELAESYGLKNFISFCLCYVLENYEYVVESEEFLEMSCNRLLEFIRNEYLCANEEMVYESVMKWIKHDKENRAKYLPDILEHVRLPLVSPSFLQHSVDSEPLIKLNVDCTKYLTEAYAVQAVDGTGLEVSNSIRTQYRQNYLECFLLISDARFQHHPLVFNIVTNQWTELKCITVPKLDSSTSYMLNDGRFIDVGGLTDQVTDLESFLMNDHDESHYYFPMNRASIFDFNDKNWIQIKQMKNTHNLCNIAQIGSRVYVVECHKNEYYNIELHKWFGMNIMGPTRSDFEVISFNESLYIIGGTINNCATNIVEKYDPKTDTLSSVAPMLFPRGRPTLCVLKDCIYAIGGFEYPSQNLKKVEMYDPKTNCWKSVTNMNCRRAKVGAVCMNGNIYVIGGNTNYSMEMYNPYTQKWSMMNSIIPSTLGCNSVCRAFVLNRYTQKLCLSE